MLDLADGGQPSDRLRGLRLGMWGAWWEACKLGLQAQCVKGRIPSVAQQMVRLLLSLSA